MGRSDRRLERLTMRISTEASSENTILASFVLSLWAVIHVGPARVIPYVTHFILITTHPATFCVSIHIENGEISEHN